MNVNTSEVLNTGRESPRRIDFEINSKNASVKIFLKAGKKGTNCGVVYKKQLPFSILVKNREIILTPDETYLNKKLPCEGEVYHEEILGPFPSGNWQFRVEDKTGTLQSIRLNISMSKKPDLSRVQGELLQDALKMQHLFQRRRFALFLKYLPDNLVKSAGGRGKVILGAHTEYESSQRDGFIIQRTLIFVRKRVIKIEKKYYGLVEQHSLIETPDGPMHLRSHLLGVKEHEAERFQFSEVNALSPPVIQKIYGSLPQQIIENFYNFSGTLR